MMSLAVRWFGRSENAVKVLEFCHSGQGEPQPPAIPNRFPRLDSRRPDESGVQRCRFGREDTRTWPVSRRTVSAMSPRSSDVRGTYFALEPAIACAAERAAVCARGSPAEPSLQASQFVSHYQRGRH